MKKNYIIPEALTLCMTAEHTLAGSNRITSSGDVIDIDYGGISDGNTMPEVKRSYYIWEED